MWNGKVTVPWPPVRGLQCVHGRNAFTLSRPRYNGGGLITPRERRPPMPGRAQGASAILAFYPGPGYACGPGPSPFRGRARAGAMGPGRECIPFVKVPPDYGPPWGAGCPCNIGPVSGAGRGARCRVGAPRRGVRYRVLPYCATIISKGYTLVNGGKYEISMNG